MKKIDRTGEKNINNFGSNMFILEYRNANDIIVKFENGYTIQTKYRVFRLGQISNPYDKTICGVGYLGEGKYKVTIGGKKTKEYEMWNNILRLCYNEKTKEKQPTYKDCTICDEWLNFQNFAQWYNDNYYEIEGQEIQIDKDILIKGNKLYSPGTCVFVSRRINMLFTKNDARRGNLPIGVSYNTIYKKYSATCKNLSLKYYDTPEKAFEVYKNFKEKVILKIANEDKSKIPKKLYNAMINYKVEIAD